MRQDLRFGSWAGLVANLRLGIFLLFVAQLFRGGAYLYKIYEVQVQAWRGLGELEVWTGLAELGMGIFE